MSGGIVFQVETSRVLQILAREIYDSPLALIRENLQNAYDAVRMRFAADGVLAEGGRIDMQVGDGKISISDNGIGMSEKVLRENFWTPGSSGKHSDVARKAGVVGTFGIGAMANFGVCRQLIVETRQLGSDELLRSVADRDSLKIGEDCIRLERTSSTREVGTTVTAVLDNQNSVTAEVAKQYLQPYVSLLPVPVYVNGECISGNSMSSRLPLSGRGFASLGIENWHNNLYHAKVEVQADQNGQLLVYITEIKMGGEPVEGEMALLQASGQLLGLRSYFGLAPIPAAGAYQFGGFASLSFLQPTAGREALSRESIDQVSQLIGIAETAASTMLAKSPLADRNNAFLEWISSRSQYELAGKVAIRVLPDDKDVPMDELKSYLGPREARYYPGSDPHILRTFATESACLLLVVQGNPRRNVQRYYLANVLKIPEVPNTVQITRVYEGSQLSFREVSVLVRTATILREDYLLGDIEPVFADISHNVSVSPNREGDRLKLYIARSSPILLPVLEFYDKAPELFYSFMKDFVRVQIYPKVQQFVPSSTRDGVDALRRVLERNRELYRYAEDEMGDFEGVIGDYLSGRRDFADVLHEAQSKARPQTQSVSSHQVGSVEDEVPGVVDSPVSGQMLFQEQTDFSPSPPIIRDSVSSKMKILTTSEKYSQLNGFTMFLGLSDRLMLMESEFFRTPHTTRILWGGHRVIYIFTETTGRLSLYYDISLREPIQALKASGGMFRTTTLITTNRIFVPIPDALVNDFKVAQGSKEFYVRFDIVSNETSAAA